MLRRHKRFSLPVRVGIKKISSVQKILQFTYALCIFYETALRTPRGAVAFFAQILPRDRLGNELV
jgi:hypothetical protein